MKPSRATNFAVAINGLLKKRADLIRANRGRLEWVEVDLMAIDRVLRLLGYDGDIEAATRFKKREAVFGPGELSRAIFEQLRSASAPLRTRDLASAILANRGLSPDDAKARAELVRRATKALGRAKVRGLVQSVKDQAGNMVWARKGAGTLLPGNSDGG